VSAVGNLASSSNIERDVFGPATAVVSVLTAVVARRVSRPTVRRGGGVSA